MAVEASLPTIGVVLATAAVDAINPCAIGVMILLVSSLIKAGEKRRILTVGIIYTVAVFVVYFLAGLGLISFLTRIPTVVAQYITMVVALIVIGAGLLEVKDFFWYGKGTSLMMPERYAKKVAERMSNLDTMSYGGIVLLGAFVAAVELPCTGGPYLAITTVLAQRGIDALALGLLAIYNVIFVSPLLVIVALTYVGRDVTDMKRWKHEYRPHMRLLTGVVIVMLGWFLLMLGSSAINLA